MIKHIVMWKFKESACGNSKDENIKIFKEGLESLIPIIPEIKSLEVQVDSLHLVGSYDVILISTFESVDALNTYSNHPEHVKVALFNKEAREARAAVDFEF